MKKQPPQQQPPEQQFSPEAPIRCRRCPTLDLIRLRKTRSNDKDVFRCPHCGLIFSPPSPSPRSLPRVVPAKAGTHATRPPLPSQPTQTPIVVPVKTPPPSPSVHPERREQVAHPAAKSDVQPAPGVEGHLSQLWRATKNPKLDSYANATSATTPGSPKRFPSYDAGRLSAPPPPPRIAPKTGSPSYGMRPQIPSWTATAMRPMRPLSATKKTFSATVLVAP